jgi:CheY-like chemotaxis protein/cytoskeletal protein RodZ
MALILAIDEDVVLTMSLDLQLGHVGHSVRRVSTIAQAKTAYKEQPPDVIVIDPTMSEQEGWGLVEQWSTQIPTVIMSHDPTDATERRAQAAGVRAVLRKPLLVRELIDAIMPFVGEATPLQAERPVASDTVLPASGRQGQRSANPTAAERRAARERVRAAEGLPAETPQPPQTTTQNNADPLGLGGTPDDDLLLAGLPTTSYTEVPTPEKKESLGMQLRAQRIKRNIPLNQVDLVIGVHMAYLQAMEEDRFSHLPRGRMAEEMISKYVKYLNLDVAAALLQYRSFQYSEPVEPITDYGAANLVVIRYSGLIRTILAVLFLAGMGYGIWTYEQQRIIGYLGQLRSMINQPTPTATTVPPVTATSVAAVVVTEVPTNTTQPTLTASTVATATPPPETQTPSGSATNAPTETIPATATNRRTATPTASATATASKTNTPTRTATTRAQTRTPRQTATAVRRVTETARP